MSDDESFAQAMTALGSTGQRRPSGSRALRKRHSAFRTLDAIAMPSVPSPNFSADAGDQREEEWQEERLQRSARSFLHRAKSSVAVPAPQQLNSSHLGSKLQNGVDWTLLPDTLLIVICSFLRGIELALAASVCKLWREIIGSDLVPIKPTHDVRALDEHQKLARQKKARYSMAIQALWRSASINAGFMEADAMEIKGKIESYAVDPDTNSGVDPDSNDSRSIDPDSNSRLNVNPGSGQFSHGQTRSNEPLSEFLWLKLRLQQHLSDANSNREWLRATRTCWFERCCKEFDSFSALVQHFRQQHGQPNIQVCNFSGLGCKWTFIDCNLLSLHRRYQHPTYLRRLRCSHKGCNLLLADEYDLRDHLNSHVVGLRQSHDEFGSNLLLTIGGKTVQAYPGSPVNFRLFFQYSVQECNRSSTVFARRSTLPGPHAVGFVTFNPLPLVVVADERQWRALPVIRDVELKQLFDDARTSINGRELVLWSRYLGGCLAFVSPPVSGERLRPCSNLEPYSFSQATDAGLVELRRFTDSYGETWLCIFARHAPHRLTASAFEEPRWLPLETGDTVAEQRARVASSRGFDLCVRTNAFQFDACVCALLSKDGNDADKN